MPCMGPTWDDTLPEKITEDILSLLAEKYGIHNAGLNELNNSLDFDNHLKKRLLDVIAEIVQSDAFNGF